MAGLKELRTRIETIKSTEKITSAMKMVAAARLRRSQGLIEKCRFYNNNILASANRVLFELRQEEQKKNVRFVYPELMRGSGKAENYLLLVFTSDRGLCGSYNSNVAREASKRIEELLGGGKNVKILCIGKKGRDILKRKYAGMIVDTIEGIARKGAKYYEAVDLGQRVLDMYAKPFPAVFARPSTAKSSSGRCSRCRLKILNIIACMRRSMSTRALFTIMNRACWKYWTAFCRFFSAAACFRRLYTVRHPNTARA